jgi:hypothetical protein
LRIAGNIQRDALPGMRLLNRLILRMQTAHAHRFIHAGQPQRIPTYFTDSAVPVTTSPAPLTVNARSSARRKR